VSWKRVNLRHPGNFPAEGGLFIPEVKLRSHGFGEGRRTVGRAGAGPYEKGVICTEEEEVGQTENYFRSA